MGFQKEGRGGHNSAQISVSSRSYTGLIDLPTSASEAAEHSEHLDNAAEDKLWMLLSSLPAANWKTLQMRSTTHLSMMEQTTDRSAMRIASYNLHGLNQGTDILQHLCEDVELSMIMIQEHWQSCDNLNKILCFSTDFTGYGICAFENKRNSGIMIGRPYGGVAILIRDHLVKFVNKIICEERFVILCPISCIC